MNRQKFLHNFWASEALLYYNSIRFHGSDVNVSFVDLGLIVGVIKSAWKQWKLMTSRGRVEVSPVCP